MRQRGTAMPIESATILRGLNTTIRLQRTN